MPILALVSAKGSPGTTTAAAAITAVESADGMATLLVGLDPSGDDIWVRATLAHRRSEHVAAGPVLEQVVRAVGQGEDADDWLARAVEVLPGVRAMAGPTSVVAARTTIAHALGPGETNLLGQALAEVNGLVVVDAGRWDASQPTAARITGAHLVALTCRSTAESLEHARWLVDELRRVARCPVGVVVVGSRPYSGEEIAGLLGVPLLGIVEWDERGVAALWAAGATKAGLNTRLGRSVLRQLLPRLGDSLARPAPPPSPGERFDVAGRAP